MYSNWGTIRSKQDLWVAFHQRVMNLVDELLAHSTSFMVDRDQLALELPGKLDEIKAQWEKALEVKAKHVEDSTAGPPRPRRSAGHS